MKSLSYSLLTLIAFLFTLPVAAQNAPAPDTFTFQAQHPSLESATEWALRTFKRTEPVVLDRTLVIPATFKERKNVVITCTILLKIIEGAYELRVINPRHSGNGWREDITDPEVLSQMIHLHLMPLRYDFEFFLARAE